MLHPSQQMLQPASPRRCANRRISEHELSIATRMILQAARTRGLPSWLPRAPTPEAMLVPHKPEVLLSRPYEDLEVRSCDISEVDDILQHSGKSCPRSRQARHHGPDGHLRHSSNLRVRKILKLPQHNRFAQQWRKLVDRIAYALLNLKPRSGGVGLLAII